MKYTLFCILSLANAWTLPKYDIDGNLIEYDCNLENVNTAGDQDGYEGG